MQARNCVGHLFGRPEEVGRAADLGSLLVRDLLIPQRPMFAREFCGICESAARADAADNNRPSATVMRVFMSVLLTQKTTRPGDGTGDEASHDSVLPGKIPAAKSWRTHGHSLRPILRRQSDQLPSPRGIKGDAAGDAALFQKDLHPLLLVIVFVFLLDCSNHRVRPPACSHTVRTPRHVVICINNSIRATSVSGLSSWQKCPTPSS